jgi:hypothetical protein
LSFAEARISLKGAVPVIQVQIRNSGQSPVKALRACYGFAPSITTHGFSYVDLELSEPHYERDIAANDSVWLPVWHPPIPLTSEQMETWREGGPAVLAIKIEISGEDVFGKKVEEVECFAMPIGPIGDGQFHTVGTFASMQATARANVMHHKMTQKEEE